MASIDSEAISNFEQSYRRATKDFTSSQYYYIPDFNQGSYSSGQIKFDTLTAKDQLVIWADSYLQIPLTVSAAGGGTAYLSPDPIAFKTSVLDLITGIVILSCSGQTIVNETSVNYINTIRRLLDSAYEAQFGNLNELMMWKDSSSVSTADISESQGWFSAGFVPPFATNQQNPYIGNAAPIVTSANPNHSYNDGFNKRIQFFKSNATFAANTFTITCYLPLRYLHPLFEKMDFPITNARFQFYFNTAITNSATAITQNCPLLHGVNNSNNSGAAVPMTDYVMSIVGPCNLYYRKVTYSPEDNAKVAEMISRGHKLTLEFPSMDFYPSISQNQAPGTVANNVVVSPSTVAPLRLWALCLPVGYVSGSLANIQQAPFITNNRLTRFNALINSQPYYDNDLSTTHDLWQVVEENTIGAGFKESLGALLGWKDFLSNYSLNLIDLSRIKDRLANPSEAVNISCRWTLNNANGNLTNNSDVLYIVERNTVVEFTFSSGTVNVAIGSQAS